jgi:hypothetical protein
MNWTREQAIRDVLEASDGAEGLSTTARASDAGRSFKYLCAHLYG